VTRFIRTMKPPRFLAVLLDRLLAVLATLETAATKVVVFSGTRTVGTTKPVVHESHKEVSGKSHV
jgi:hypothetical protein